CSARGRSEHAGGVANARTGVFGARQRCDGRSRDRGNVFQRRQSRPGGRIRGPRAAQARQGHSAVQSRDRHIASRESFACEFAAEPRTGFEGDGMMQKMLAALGGLTLIAAIALSLSAASTPPKSFTPAQEAEIGAIVKQYLLDHPEVLIDSMNAL